MNSPVVRFNVFLIFTVHFFSSATAVAPPSRHRSPPPLLPRDSAHNTENGRALAPERECYSKGGRCVSVLELEDKTCQKSYYDICPGKYRTCCIGAATEGNQESDRSPLQLQSETASRPFGSVSQEPNSQVAVSCEHGDIEVVVPHHLLPPGTDGSLASLRDTSCRPYVETFGIVFNFNFAQCGTTMTQDKNILVLQNKVTIPRAITNGISRQQDRVFNIVCVYNRIFDGMQFHFKVITPKEVSLEKKAYGVLSFDMKVYTDVLYQNLLELSSHGPLAIDTPLYVSIDSNSDLHGATFRLWSLSAFPVARPDDGTPSHKIVEKGCVKDDTFLLISVQEQHFRFRINTFAFVDYPSVYFTASVVLCRKVSADPVVSLDRFASEGGECLIPAKTSNGCDENSGVDKTNAPEGEGTEGNRIIDVPVAYGRGRKRRSVMTSSSVTRGNHHQIMLNITYRLPLRTHKDSGGNDIARAASSSSLSYLSHFIEITLALVVVVCLVIYVLYFLPRINRRSRFLTTETRTP